MNAPMQLAAPRFLDKRRGFQKQLMTRVRRNLSELDRQLAGQKSCSRLRMEGGWNTVLRVPATRSAEELAIELRAPRDVYAHPGHFYDFPSNGYLILSLLSPEPESAN